MGNYISVGGKSTLLNSSILISSDTFNWSINTEYIDIPNFIGYWGLQGIGCSDQEIIAAGWAASLDDAEVIYGLILRSTDGVNWSSQLISHESNWIIFDDVSYLNGYFYITGDGGRIFQSENGTQWIKVHEEGSGYLNKVVFGKGKYIAVSEQPGMILTSVDGENWTKVPNWDSSDNLLSVEYAEEQFVAVGWRMNGNSPIYRSFNGTTWNEEESNVREALYGVKFLNGKFIAIGERMDLIYNPINYTVYLISDPLPAPKNQGVIQTLITILLSD